MLSHVKDILDRLTKRQQVILAMSTVFSVVGILLMAMIATKTQMSLLYSGLDEITIAELALKLDNMKVQHENRNGAVYVDKKQRDKVRMELAREGLPKKGQQGYELLDNVSGFGTTSEMFQATYWRAKEGEIARTITSMEEVEDARVHIAPQKKTAFNREDNHASASVMVKMKGGASPDKGNARAIKYMVALAVGNLSPNQVTVIDASTGKIIGGNEDDPDYAMIQKRSEMEHKMIANLEEMIGAHVGFDKVKVRVAIDVDNKEEILRQKQIDPNSRTIISTSNSEKNETSQDKQAGEVSAGTNVPNGASDGEGGSSSSKRTESDEKVNYEVSQTERESRTRAGAVSRLSVAVLVDDMIMIKEKGKMVARPRTQEDLDTIAALVKSASGFDEKRGDTVTVKALSFVRPPEMSSPPHVVWEIIEQNFDLMIEAFALLLSIAGIAFGVVRPILRMGGDSKHKEEISKLKAMYEEQIQALLPEEIDLEEINPMQMVMSDVEDAILNDPEEALTIIRQWLHESQNQQKEAPQENKSRNRMALTAGG